LQAETKPPDSFRKTIFDQGDKCLVVAEEKRGELAEKVHQNQGRLVVDRFTATGIM